MIKAGFSEKAITPRLGLPIPGYFETRLADGQLDELFAKAVMFEEDATLTGIVMVDAVHLERVCVQMIRDRFEKLSGRPGHTLMVAATHCHTAMPTEYEGHASAQCSKEDTERLAELIGDCAYEAYGKLQPVRMGWGAGEERGISFNRRWFMKDGKAHTWPGIGNPDNVKPAGPVDYELDVLRVEDLSGKTLGIITNFANHLDLIGGTKYCADFPGELSRQLKRELGSDVVSVFVNGCCGDVTHIDYTGKVPFGPDHYQKCGRILAFDVMRLLEDVTTAPVDGLKTASKTVSIGRRQYTEEQIAEAHATIKAIEEKRAYTPAVVSAKDDDEYVKPTAGDPDTMALSYATSAIELSEHPILTEEAEMQVIILGDVAISSMPGEMFAEIGLNLKAASPFKKNMIVELANNSSGYIAAEHAFDEGGYEVTLDYYTFVERNAESLINGALLEMLHQAKA